MLIKYTRNKQVNVTCLTMTSTTNKIDKKNGIQKMDLDRGALESSSSHSFPVWPQRRNRSFMLYTVNLTLLISILRMDGQT